MIRSFVRLFELGGWVIYPIFTVLFISSYIGIGKIIKLRYYIKAHKLMMSALKSNQKIVSFSGLPSAFVILMKKLQVSRKTTIRQQACTEFLGELIPSAQSGISTIATCAVMAPLLGLLGTISGMNEMFSIIGIFGFGNPTIMSSSISVALQASLTGLGVAVAALFLYDFVQRTKTKLFDKLVYDLEHLSEGDDIENGKGADMSLGKNRLLTEENEKPDINLAPFVDTMTVLLIFFVVTANLYVETGVDVSKPKATSSKPMNQKSILIGITREGTVHIYGRQVNLDRLKVIVEKETSKQPDISVVIIADREVDVGRAVEVMDNCMMAGATKVSIAASKEG